MVRSEKETPILSRNRRGAFWRGDAYLSARRGEGTVPRDARQEVRDAAITHV
jgi:hypothetical protein